MPQSKEKLPNIIVILMDAAGAKRCSVYGHQRDTTPGLSRIAAEGTLYKHCFAPAPWTIPSHASLFSGLYASEHGCDEKSLQLPEMVYSLPEILQQRGYHTVAISSNSLVTFRRGFDVFYEMDTISYSEDYHINRIEMMFAKKSINSEFGRFKYLLQYIWEKKCFHFLIINILDRLYRNNFVNIFNNSSKATKKSFDICKYLLKKHRNKNPLFIFVNVMETHWKYNPPPEYHKVSHLDQKARQEILQPDPFAFFVHGISPETLSALPLLYEEALGVLRSLSRRYTLGALTNGNADIYKTDAGEYFDFAFLAEEIGTSKPHPDMFHAALEQAGAAPAQIVHVGDNPEHDIQGAKAVGMRTVWMNARGMEWPGGEEADREIDNLLQLPEAISSIEGS